MRLTSAFVLLTATFLHAQTPKPLAFDVATVKPSDPNSTDASADDSDGKFEYSNTTLKGLILIAYHLRKEQVFGGPAWVNSGHFDVRAKYEPLASAPKQQQRELEERIRSLLAERFQLVTKFESREIPIYTLVVAKNGPKLQSAKNTTGSNAGTRSSPGTLTGISSTLEMLANALGLRTDKPVIDQTGIRGKFDYHLEWSPDPSPGKTAPELLGPSLFTAVQEQLGLKLKPQKAMMPVLIIERAEKASAN